MCSEGPLWHSADPPSIANSNDQKAMRWLAATAMHCGLPAPQGKQQDPAGHPAGLRREWAGLPLYPFAVCQTHPHSVAAHKPPDGGNQEWPLNAQSLLLGSESEREHHTAV